MKKLLKTLCSFLITILLIQSLSPGLSVTAARNSSASPVGSESALKARLALSSLIDKDGYLTDDGLLNLGTLPYEEEKFTEVIKNVDGTNSLKLFSSPIKYKDENGNWQPIDNSIKPADANKDGQHAYKNSASDVNLLFSDNLDQKDAIRMSFSDYVIAFKPINTVKSNGKSVAELVFIQSGKTENDQIKDSRFDAAKKYESVEYTKTFSENTKIRITPRTNGLKEDIIFASLPEQREFAYDLIVENALPILRRDGNVYFVDLEKGIWVASIAAPYMYDSAEESRECGDIEVQLEKLSEGCYRYTLIPDRTFLEDKKTVYPVILDPSCQTSTSDVQDTYIASKYPNTNYYSNDYVKVGFCPDLDVVRGLIKIRNWPTALEGMAITSAYYKGYQNYVGYTNPLMDIVQVTNYYDPTTIKWGTGTNIQLGSIYSQLYVYTVGWYSWDVTTLVQGWHSGTITNYGMCLKNNNETINMYKRFYSTNYSSDQNYFLINYTDGTPPTVPLTFTATPSFSGPTGNVSLNWSTVSDLPTTGASGVNRFEVGYSPNNGIWTDVSLSPSALSHTFTGLLDNSIYDFRIRAVDNNGNAAAYKFIEDLYTPDKTGPTAPASYTISTSGWTNDVTPTFAWSGITDEGNHITSSLSKIEYKIDSGNFQNLNFSSRPLNNGSFDIDTTGLSEGTHTICIRAVDSEGNTGAQSSITNYLKDTVAPSVSLSVSDTTPDGIFYITASVDNSAGGSGFGSWTLEYGCGNPASSYPNVLTSGTTTFGSQIIYEFDTSGLIDNYWYTIRLRVNDAAGNAGSAIVIFMKAEGSTHVLPGLQIDQPSQSDSDGYWPDLIDADQFTLGDAQTPVMYQKTNDGGIVGLLPGKLYVNNKLHVTETTAGEGFIFNAAAYDNGWLYPEGSIAFLYVQTKDNTGEELYSAGTMEALEISDTFSDSSKIENLNQVVCTNSTVRLNSNAGVYYPSGSFESINRTFAGDVSYVDLTVLQTVPSGGDVAYLISVNNGVSWQPVVPVSTDGGATVNLANRFYFTTNPSGSSIKLQAILTKSVSLNQTPVIDSWSLDVRYTTYATAILVDNSFPKDARGMTNLSNTIHDEVNELISLKTAGSGYEQAGSIESSPRQTSNDVYSVCLEVDQTLPTGTGITYKISTNNGASWEVIPANGMGAAGNPNNYTLLAQPGKQIILKAQLTGNGTVTPILSSWRLVIEEKIAGQAHMIKLVDEPWNLSTLVDANYMTLLRWEASETDDVSYNIYRSSTPYFVPSATSLVASGITGCSWSDYNLNFGETFYYKVTAVAQISGHARESLPSNEAWATVVEEDEMNKRLGLQNYWSYSGFSTGSGTGYINVSNGNLAYITTDLVLPDPFLAVVMRRTFNSLADTKTPMGYGWDFSLNTRLLKVYDSYSNETAMILKDGDGSFHIFDKTGQDTYASAKGTLMTLTRNHTLGEYQIRRRDNIVYHFDDQSMQIKSFSDNNGNRLTYRYDSRGNLWEVENTVGEKITLDYYVVDENLQIVQINNPDYVFINAHPDMLKSMTWTEDVEQNSAVVTYNYEYDADFDKLTRAYTLVEGNILYEEEFDYDPVTGELVSITDPEDKVTGISYDSAGRVDIVTDAIADSYDFNYTANGLDELIATGVTSKYDVTVSYDYDLEGRVTCKTDPMGHSVSYSYNDDCQVTGVSYLNMVNGSSTPTSVSTVITYENGNIKTITAPDGAVTTYGSYNSFNRPLSVSVAKTGQTTRTTTYTYDSCGNLLTTTDPEGKVTTNSYDIENGDPGYLVQVENDFGGQTKYSYNSKGQVDQVDAYINNTFSHTLTTYLYDYNADGYFQTVNATDGVGNETITCYDRLGRAVEVIYADEKNQATTYSLAGTVLTSTDRMNHETVYDYDDLYRLTQITYTDASTASIQYLKWNSDNNTGTGYGVGGLDADKIVKIDGTGVQNIEYYDVAGRLVRTAISDGTTELVTANYQYDLIGNCVQVTDAKGRVSRAEYNELNQTTRTIIDPTGENIQSAFTYDLAGNRLSTINGEGYTTSNSYDLNSRLTGVSQIVSSNTLTTAYDYDIEAGGYIKNRVTDAKGNVSEAWFDALGRKLFDYNIGNPGDSVVMQTGYTYNNNGQVLIITRNDNTKEKYTYNNLGQVARVDYYEATENTADDSDDYIEYAYNDNGQLDLSSVYHSSSVESTDYGYDAKGRLDQITEGSLASGGILVDYDYDNADRIVEIRYTKENSVRHLGYDYDDYGRIWKITLQIGSGPINTVREYIYQACGELDYIKNYRNFENDMSDYIKIACDINDAGLTEKITYTDHEDGGTGVIKEQYDLVYDKRGYITDETIYTNYSSAQTVNKSFVYDEIGRLTSATVDSQTTSYTYDNVGNRLSMNDGTDVLGYNYNQFNQLLNVTKNNNAYLSYGYDNRGNQTSEVFEDYLSVTIGQTTTTYDRTTAFDYDLMNQLGILSTSTPVADAQGNVTYSQVSTTNTYNAAGQRVKRFENGKTTKYYYSGSAILFTTDVNNLLQTENILDLGGSIVASQRFDVDQNPNTPDPYAGDYFFYNYDCRGSTASVIAPNGTLTTGYAYDEYGNQTRVGAVDFLNDVTFTGSVSDTASGLQYMNARFYNPSTGRFLSQDTYTGNAYDPWTQHLYAYCGNNPVNMIDPTGHFFNLIAGAIGAAVGAAIGAGITLVGDYLDDGQINTDWKVYAGAAACGAINGLAAGVTCGASLAVQIAATAGAGAVLGTAGSVVRQGITGGFDNVDYGQAAIEGVIAGVSAGALRGAGALGKKVIGNFKGRWSGSVKVGTDSVDDIRPYTKSNLRLGQEMHKTYKSDLSDGITKFKEYRLPSGRRIDFIDFENKTIYELKPYNPKQISSGTKQLNGYLKEVVEEFGDGWSTVLDTY
jgi:RHS repeat-associated protein